MQFSVRVEAFDSNLIQVGCPHSVSQKAQIPCRKSEWLITYLYIRRTVRRQPKKQHLFFCILGLQILAPWAPTACFLVSFKKALSLQKWWFLRDRLLQWDPHWSPYGVFFCRPPWQAYRKLSMKWHPDKNQDNQELPRSLPTCISWASTKWRGAKKTAFGMMNMKDIIMRLLVPYTWGNCTSWDIFSVWTQVLFWDVALLPKTPMVFQFKGCHFPLVSALVSLQRGESTEEVHWN